MPIVNISRKQSTLVGFQIDGPADMHEVLEYIAPGGGIDGNGYTGSVIQQNSGTEASVVWQLLINDPVNNTSAFAKIGDAVVLENNCVLSVVKAENIAALYDID